MLGHDVRSAVQAAGGEAVALTRAELDIRDAAAVDAAVRAARPDAVINCAAFTDVDGAEAREAEAQAVNADGAGNVAAAAAAAGAWTVHVSTDYVFDGRTERPYVESDPVGPLGAYGRSKLAGERERLDVVCDQVGCPTYTGHLAPALVSLAQAEVPGVLHVTGSGSCSWHELAVAVVQAAGIDCEVRPIRTADYPTPAQRPAYSVLASERGAPALAHWREGLSAFMAALSREVSA